MAAEPRPRDGAHSDHDVAQTDQLLLLSKHPHSHVVEGPAVAAPRRDERAEPAVLNGGIVIRVELVFDIDNLAHVFGHHVPVPRLPFGHDERLVPARHGVAPIRSVSRERGVALEVLQDVDDTHTTLFLHHAYASWELFFVRTHSRDDHLRHGRSVRRVVHSQVEIRGGVLHEPGLACETECVRRFHEAAPALFNDVVHALTPRDAAGALFDAHHVRHTTHLHERVLAVAESEQSTHHLVRRGLGGVVRCYGFCLCHGKVCVSIELCPDSPNRRSTKRTLCNVLDHSPRRFFRVPSCEQHEEVGVVQVHGDLEDDGGPLQLPCQHQLHGGAPGARVRVPPPQMASNRRGTLRRQQPRRTETVVVHSHVLQHEHDDFFEVDL
eukprot:PhM_4_TR6216/c0_g1_i1/m.59753